MARIAAVTGATGIVGQRIVELLLGENFKVRVLTRKPHYAPNFAVKGNLEIVNGDLCNPVMLDKLVRGVDWLFHCAAELNNEAVMEAVNVTGTQNLIEAAKKANIEIFCHMSSVGVIGSTAGTLADETTECQPLNIYELTKYQAEQFVLLNPCAKHTMILRPTNVVSETKPGPLAYVIYNSPKNRLKLFLKGQERAHLIHAKDVAAATIFCAKNALKLTPGLGSHRSNFVESSQSAATTFVLSLDHEPRNIIATVCQDYLMFKHKSSALLCLNMPWQAPYYLRKLMGRPCNRSDLKYSSAKLLATGFRYPLGLEGAIKDICEHT